MAWNLFSVKFSWGPSHRKPHNQIFVGFGPLYLHCIGSYVFLIIFICNWFVSSLILSATRGLVSAIRKSILLITCLHSASAATNDSMTMTFRGLALIRASQHVCVVMFQRIIVKNFFARLVCLVIVPLTVYTFIFYIHVSLLCFR